LTRLVLAAGIAVAGVAAAAEQDVPWPSYNGTPQSDRFSRLTQITPQTAADLREACETEVGDGGSFETGPIVVDGVLFLTSVHTVLAVDAANCSVRWRYVYTPDEEETTPGNRGAAYMDGRIFRGTADGRVVALDAATGRELWRVKAAEPDKGELFSAAPIAWKGLVFLGPGGDFPTRGRVSAFDAATGKEVWRFNTVPAVGEPGFETWHVAENAQYGGGGTWTSYTLDPEAGELFVPIGNPLPVFENDSRPGTNLYTDAIVVLDATTGKLKWYYQFDPNDGLDYDLGAAPALYTDRTGRRRIAAGSKDGHLYILDRDTHTLVSKTPVTTVTKPTRSPDGLRFCPGVVGGVEWNGPAYSPVTNTVYVGSVDWCVALRKGQVKAKQHLSTLIYALPDQYLVHEGPRTGWFYGVEATTGKTLWRYHAESPVLAGATPTAGDVVFSGESSGNLLVFEASTGKLLKKLQLGGSIGGGVITYSVGTKQYVAITTGNISRSSLNVGADTKPRLHILTTGLDPSYQLLKVAAAPPEQLYRRIGPDQGKAAFTVYCTTCHGMGGSGGVSAPSLIGEGSRQSLSEIVEWIKNPKPPMPKLAPPLTNQDVDDVARYVRSLK
jgi:alcohol dehydrogenase (cytochrome c)